MPLDRLASLVRGLIVLSVAEGADPGADVSLEAFGEGYRLRVGPADGALVSVHLDPGHGADALAGMAGRVTEIAADSPLAPLAALLVAEARAPGCGSAALLSAYAQALLVHLLRAQIRAGTVASGLLAGLADPRLARALTAIHDAPGRTWQAGELAEVAGMSRTAFAERFRAVVGETPIGYLRRWRLQRAREALRHGGRVGQVARQFGYGSPDAFARAFRAAEGRLPSELRA